MTKEEIEDRIQAFRKHLDRANALYEELLDEKVYADFYSGKKLMQVPCLPDKAIFKRQIVETFG